MTTMFWILWFFIAFLVLLVAFTPARKTKRCHGVTSFVRLNRPGRWAWPSVRSCGSFMA